MTRTTTTFGHSGQAMNEMNVNLLLFLERTLFKDQIVPSGVSSPLRNFFSRLLVRRLLVGVTSSNPAHTRGGGFGWWCNSNTHYTYTIHDTQTQTSPHTQELLHNTHMYTWYIWLQIQIYEHMHCMHICSMFNCSSIPQIHSGVSQIPNAMQQRMILKSTLGGEPATLCCCVADRLKQTLRYLAH